MKKSKITILIFLFMLLNCKLTVSQSSLTNDDIIENIIESMVEKYDEPVDYSELSDQIQNLLENPVNINTQECTKLRELNLVNDHQIINLQNYISKYGKLNTVYELQMVDGFDFNTVYSIRFLITTNDNSSQAENKNRKNYFRQRIKNNLLLRYSRVIQVKNGYNKSDSIWQENINKYYLGKGYGLYMRLKTRINKNINAGLLIDNDPGEPMFFSEYPDTIKRMLKNKNSGSLDYINGFVQIKNKGIIKSLVAGSYKAQFGQGLTLWNGLSFSNINDGVSLKKYPSGIKANSSATEYSYFQGLGGTFNIGKFNISLFYSSNKLDGNISAYDTIDQSPLEASSIIQTGTHRTYSEIIDKNSIKRRVYGGNITYRTNFYSIGVTAYKGKFNCNIAPENRLYNKFRFRGKTFGNIGVDYNFMLGRINLFGEISTDKSFNAAFLSAIKINLNSVMNLLVLYRNYPHKYINLYSNAFGAGSYNNDENGFFIGLNFIPLKNTEIAGYCNLYKKTWLKYKVAGITSSCKAGLQIKYLFNRGTCLTIRYRQTLDQTNEKITEKYLPGLINNCKKNIRINFVSEITSQLRLKSRIESSSYNEKHEVTSGNLCFLEMRYSFPNSLFSICLRHTIFDAPDWRTRIYSYENDVYTAFTVPAYFGKGYSSYILLNIKLFKKTDFWFRYSYIKYDNKDQISSGREMIKGNLKSEVKFQFRKKF